MKQHMRIEFEFELDREHLVSDDCWDTLQRQIDREMNKVVRNVLDHLREDTTNASYSIRKRYDTLLGDFS